MYRSKRQKRSSKPLKPASGWNKLKPLIQRRLDQGIRAIEIAQLYGVSPARICLLESGAVPVTADALSRYNAALRECESLVAEQQEQDADGGEA